ncbi:hypothetical protein XMD543_001598 [Marinobacterium sp. xm-d-543]|uniref:hypothetical protein n=1 Tax=Marinobacterium sp. xm-d-543 TaxID=2497740 RepID=UPI0015684652|nr:hypothetical protein [Marinobacterium sp. xm-d-543]NRP47548.1 hypothetical protein [Marinobacterium sp. xm-d-543]
MQALKLISFTIAVLIISGCQTKPSSAEPKESAEPLIIAIQEQLQSLPSSYFNPLAKDLVIGIQIQLFNIKDTSGVFFSSDGKRWIKTDEDIMIEIGKVNEQQLKAVGEVYMPVLTSAKLNLEIIKFSNRAVNSKIAQDLGMKDLIKLTQLCTYEMSRSALDESNSLNLRHNTLLNPENFSASKRLKAKQAQTADFIQANFRKLFNKEIPAITSKKLVRQSLEYCVSLDYEIGNAVMLASLDHLRNLGKTQSTSKEAFDRLVGFTKLAGLDEGKKVTPKK